MRLNKHISDTGFCSRREADRLIAERRVTVNGVVAGVGTHVEEGDTVLVDGQALRARAVSRSKGWRGVSEESSCASQRPSVPESAVTWFRQGHFKVTSCQSAWVKRTGSSPERRTTGAPGCTLPRRVSASSTGAAGGPP